ncbi:CUB domain protein [Oesophagostomum dentatum]|uniref:CUB domain protein n=1 Tax=Oesophagostomum dentatum TaxID=61180 RepID=A0A0B1S3S1_OESDE|nr:CUB domain protein [Oesophagostomum dentatum]
MTNSQRLPPWVGASRDSSGAFKWSSGMSVSSIFWAQNEPTIYGDCATLRSNGMAACPCYNLQPALCKLKPQLCNDGTFGGPNLVFGTINSPGYPDQYYNNLDCYYQIVGPADSYITINFDPFIVENYYDFVEIYDGNTTLKLIGDLDAPEPPKASFESMSNQMLVYFHTDGVETDKGWQAQWTAKKFSTSITQSGTSGALTSTNYPNDYDIFIQQLYYITSPENTVITVTVGDFSTETDYDYLEIFDGDDVDATRIAKLSGHNVAGATVNSTGNRLTMRFITDGTNQYPGWHLLWSAS